MGGKMKQESTLKTNKSLPDKGDDQERLEM